VALNEIGVPFESTLVPSDERRSRGHRARHPLERLPAFVLDDGTMMFESSAISFQLGRTCTPSQGLLPPLGSSARALVYQWAMFGMTELEAPLYRWIGDMHDDANESPAAGRFGVAAEAIAATLDGRRGCRAISSPWRTSSVWVSSEAPL